MSFGAILTLLVSGPHRNSSGMLIGPDRQQVPLPSGAETPTSTSTFAIANERFGDWYSTCSILFKDKGS